MTWAPDTDRDRHGRLSRDPYTLRRDPQTTICRASIGPDVVYSLFRGRTHVECSARIPLTDGSARIAAVEFLKQRAEVLWPANS